MGQVDDGRSDSGWDALASLVHFSEVRMGLLLVGPCGSGPGQGLVAFGWGGGLLVPYPSIGLLHWGAASSVFTCWFLLG